MDDYVDDMSEIQRQIDELRQKRDELGKEYMEKACNEIKKLEWCHGMEVEYHVGSPAAGLPSHQLVFRSNEPLLKKADLGLSNGSITVWGNHQLYEYNVVLRKGGSVFRYDFPGTYTFNANDVGVLCEFIEAASLKIKLDENKALLYKTLLKNRSL